MEEGSYQFIHVECYGREGSKQTKTKRNGDTSTSTKWNARDIFAEQWRLEGDCNHVPNPRKPGLLFGVPPMEILPMIDEWADQAQDAQGRKLRKDGHCVLVGVVSLPRSMEDQFPDFAEDTLAWLKEKYGDRLKSVVYHNDEAHPHLHFSVLPRIGERFDEIHEGFKAKNKAKKEGKKAGDQNLAFIAAMRAFQDEFSQKVAMGNGLTRLGPGRRRLSRAGWKAEKRMAAFNSDAKAQHKAARKNGYKMGLKQAEEKTKGLGSKVGNWFAGALGGFHKPTAQALEQVEKAKQEAEKKKKKADAYARQAKEWADKRVATVGNQITLEKSKNAELEKEVETKDQKLEDQATLIQWYQNKFGKAPDNLPKIK